MDDIVIGIDLGTTNTCVAVYQNNQNKILINQEGGRTTPSFLFITEKDAVIVGQMAQKMAERKPEYAVSELKRLIGRRFDDPYVEKNVKYSPFKLTHIDNEPTITITRRNGEFTKSPIELYSTILRKVKNYAEDKVGKTISKAVVTVPAYFNMSQREATLEAAKKAGLTVLKLLNEPTAAALAYYMESDEEESHALVYDLGGGTFDVAILKRSSNNIDIVGVDGDACLGGHDFDNLLVDYVCNILEKDYKFNARDDHRIMRRLRGKCEDEKKILSLVEDTTIDLDGFIPDCRSVAIEITREDFEKMAHELFKRTIDIVDNCLKSCKLTKSDIKEVLLSGGSTRIPKIQEMISSYFDGKKLNKIINPDECVAEGAALQAAMLSTNPQQKITAFQIKDVTPLSLGISNFVGLMTIFIEKSTPIPVAKTFTRVTVENNQSSMTFDVYEGERINARKNRYLGRVTISDLTPAPPGQCKALFTMRIDENGILKVQAKEQLRNNVKDLTIAYTRGHRSDKEVKNAIIDAELNKQEDEDFVKFASIKEYVLNYCERVTYNLEKKKLCDSHKELQDLCEAVKQRVDRLEDLEDKSKLKKLWKKITQKGDSVAKKYNFEFMPVLKKF